MSMSDRILTIPDHRQITSEMAAKLSQQRLRRFQVVPDFGEPCDSVIDPGPVPATFVHSWAIDIAGFTSFRVAPAQAGLDLNWTSDDHVVLYVPETGQRETFTTEQDLRTRIVKLNPLPSTAPVRVYLILKTSVERWADPSERRFRRFVIEGLRPLGSVGTPRAVLVGDDLNSDTSTKLNHEPWFDDGSTDKVWQGWRQGKNTWATVEVEEPIVEQGWRLMARFTPPPHTETDLKIYALVYYNEQYSQVRLYVLPGPDVAATGLDIHLRLLGRSPTSSSDYVCIDGAFFDDNANPSTWSEAHLPITRLASNRWTMAQTSMLYPMARDLPCGEDTSGPGMTTDEGRILTNDPRLPAREDWLKPVYDSKFEKQCGNIRLQVEITAFERGTADLDFIGTGVGTAIQQPTPSGDPFLTILKDSVASAISTGKDAHKAADWVFKKVKKSYEATAAATPGAPQPGVLALGFSGFVGPVTAVAAGISFFAKAFADPEALRLALELKIRGSITGSIYTPLNSVVFDCYLPGRFNAEEMHGPEGVSLQDPTLHQLVPRYDRPLGHLGYRYDPTQLKCRSIYFGPDGDSEPRTDITRFPDQYWQWAMRCVWPANDDPKFPYLAYSGNTPWRWGPESSHHEAPIDGFLPVVFNECAEIVPIRPSSTERRLESEAAWRPDRREQASGERAQRVELPDESPIPHQPTHYHVGNIAWAHQVDPEPDDVSFPTAGVEMGPIGSRSIWTYHDSDWQGLAAWDGTVECFVENGDTTFLERDDGYWLDAGPAVWVPALRDFLHPIDVLTETFGEMSIVCYDEDHENQAPGVESVSYLDSTLDNRYFRPFEPGSPWPLADIIYGWDVRYLYYGRSRRDEKGQVPRGRVVRPMRSPVTISVKRFDCDFGMQEFAWVKTGGDAPSLMMLHKSW